MVADIPTGMWAAAAAATSQAPTVGDIRRGSFGSQGWEAETEKEHAHQKHTTPGHEDAGQEPSQSTDTSRTGLNAAASSSGTDDMTIAKASSPAQPRPSQPLRRTTTAPNGYIEPPKHTWIESTTIGLKAFWKWFLTPFGFLVTLYGLNVVAWGGMLFLLLLGAAPAMCSPNTAENKYNGCNDLYSPRRIWIEITSQILNSLFCVTGFGLIPWRFRDLYWLLRYRFARQSKVGRAGKMYGLRKLAGIHSGWFRLPGSDTLDELSSSAYMDSISQSTSVPLNEKHTTLEAGPEADDERLPLPLSKTPATPLTGVRAPPTASWIMDFVIWCQVWNTFFQACLCGFMWHYNRFQRPSWSTGFFVCLACLIAGIGGWYMFREGKKVKRVEGVRPNGDNAAGSEVIGVAGEENAKS